MTMPAPGGAAAIDAVAFGVAADLVYNIYSATNSSPQTTELFARERGATLWKYVKMGTLQAGILVGLMAWRAAAGGGWARAFWPLAGGAAAAASMIALYSHAKASGERS